ncbi:hypothetical protein RclHR1_00010054 [Rhizophagus clarus]|uniref:Sacsin/Nov domain-containing protein n=1 Tax=Rhizophagus clarus TaxID=94130 RepID=A0A2Z6Q4V0_9GLOM|nr:hypothetical protein RclHR1_00010054 [Rhizophagus clarus]GES75146.1 hypothetical protein GLOIN_2v1492674 [Rhizophagus clarus]
MSFNNFRNNVRANANEERVEINQRLLIDKILARYPSEFVVYRELMQNSDDAKSSRVQIIFESQDKVDKVVRILFKNDGSAFNHDDWNRLKRIAEGNPDEKKIGAFGVGFYSLFKICENPFVSSGGLGMDFIWHGNQLFTSFGPTGDDDKVWTTFFMDMKKPIEFPDVEKFAQFLANSLGFTENLKEVSVHFNNTLVIQLSKEMQKPKLIKIASEFNTYSSQKMFHLTSVNVRDVRLYVKRLLVPTSFNIRQLRSVSYQKEEKSIFLRIAGGNLDVKVGNEFSAEMEEIVKKKPPNKTSIQMIFTGFHEHNDDITPVFKDLLPYPKQGKIYIGFPTDQTTGCSSHLAARVIPTMSRVLVDMANETLAKYNGEMLCLAGTLCRILYEDEMDQIKQLYKEDVRILFERRAAYALRNFTFYPSTPNEKVGKIAGSHFFDCLKQPLSVLSTNGIRPISDIRMPNLEMMGFIKNVPVVPEILLEQCHTFFKKAKDSLNLIRELNFQDVLNELSSRVLSEDEMIELLKWWISYKSNRNNSLEYTQFIQSARIGNDNNVRSLNTFHHFLNPGIIPPDMDVPDNVFPYTILKKLKDQKLNDHRLKGQEFNDQNLKKWFGWSELSLVNWARFIVTKPDLENNSIFSEKVHEILARNFKKMSRNDKIIITQLFKHKECIPTTSGMKIPSKAYFENINLFPELPTIKFQNPSSVKNVMELLGVRKVVELELIFENQKNLDHMQLVKYFASKSSDLKISEMEILKDKPIWPKKSSNDEELVDRFVARDLHTPTPLHCEFGLPVIAWNKGWSNSSEEGKFLIRLGLREYPTLEKILELAAPPTDLNIRERVLKYFIDNFDKNYNRIYRSDVVNVAFLPCSDPDIYAKPSECFVNLECKIMDFKVIRQDLKFHVGKLGVHQNPNHEQLLNKLKESPPQDKDDAKKIFEYLASQQGSFTDYDWDTLANLKFIPVQDKIRPSIINYTTPNNCFFNIQEEILSDFFNCIDFGNKANKFLQSCGVKDELTPINFAELLVQSADELWKLVKKIDDGVDKYMYFLRKIALDFKILADKSSLIEKMKTTPILIAIKKVYRDEEEINDSELASAKAIYINDDMVYQQIFNPLTAPEDETLENMYKKLGCESLKRSVKEISVPKGIMGETENSKLLQEKITDRASLFYFEYPKEYIKRDENWLKKLKVREVDYIETKYTLGRIKKIKKNDTIINESMNSWILHITSDSSSLDISQHIAKNIFVVYKWKDVFCINTLLTTPLPVLKKMGYPVNRILQQQKYQPSTAEIHKNLRDNLQNFIKSCNSNTNIDSNDDDNQNSQNTINYHCDMPDNLLHYVGFMQGIKLHDTKDVQQSIILSQPYNASLSRFINMLKDLADVFELELDTINIFYSNDHTIAFNYEKTFFFNLKFYHELHDDECKIKPTVDAISFWFMTFCHELAHNFVKPHNYEHEHYFSSFAELYMPNFLAMVNRHTVTY